MHGILEVVRGLRQCTIVLYLDDTPSNNGLITYYGEPQVSEAISSRYSSIVYGPRRPRFLFHAFHVPLCNASRQKLQRADRLTMKTPTSMPTPPASSLLFLIPSTTSRASDGGEAVGILPPAF